MNIWKSLFGLLCVIIGAYLISVAMNTNWMKKESKYKKIYLILGILDMVIGMINVFGYILIE